MVREGTFKLSTDTSRFALYDLETDPNEQVNLIHMETNKTGQLRATLLRWLNEEDDLRSSLSPGKSRQLTPEMIQQLRSLGYID